MSEKYYLPVLYTEEERKKYAESNAVCCYYDHRRSDCDN